MTTPSWVMTYDSLTSTVLQYLERKDAATVNAIPTFISLAEFEIAEHLPPDHPERQAHLARAEEIFTATGARYDLPEKGL